MAIAPIVSSDTAKEGNRALSQRRSIVCDALSKDSLVKDIARD